MEDSKSYLLVGSILTFVIVGTIAGAALLARGTPEWVKITAILLIILLGVFAGINIVLARRHKIES